MRPVPNLISVARLLTVPVLIVLAAQENRYAFGVLLVAALVSDILDGLLARALSLESQLGALLDSTADALLLPVAAYGVWVFHPDIVRTYRGAFALVLLLWLGEYLVAFWRYRRLSSFHTYLARAAAYAMGIFVGGLFVFGFVPWLMWLAVVLAVCASVEEYLLLWQLPQWRSNVRGLWWVMRRATEHGQ